VALEISSSIEMALGICFSDISVADMVFGFQ